MARLTTLLFAMWLGVTVSTVVDLEKRVIGGLPCLPNERRYNVPLVDTTGGNFLCSGSLISDQWILTAGHCYEPGRTYTAYIGKHGGTLHEVQITDPPVIFADDIYGTQHDLMLLKLPYAVGIKPVPGPDCADPPKIKVQIAGHGSTKVGPHGERIPGDSSDTLYCADMDIMDCQTFRTFMCQNNEPLYSQRQHEHWMCTHTPAKDATHGDSGGGVVYKGKIYGVIVMGHSTVVGGWPLASINLCHPPYLTWINRIIHQPATNAVLVNGKMFTF